MDLSDIAEQSSEGIIAFDSAWRYRFVNTEAERVLGMPRDALIGHVIWERFPAAKTGPFYDPMLRCMKDRVPEELEQYSVLLGRWFVVRLRPLKDGGVVSYFQDIHTRHEAERRSESDRERLLFLSRVSSLLAESLDDYAGMLERLLALLVPAAADFTYLFLQSQEVEGSEGATRFDVSRSLVAHRDPEKIAMVRDALSLYHWPPAPGRRPHPIRAVMESRSPEYALRLAPEIVDSMAADAPHRATLEALDMRSMVCVPLLARGSVLGGALFARTGASDTIYTREDVLLLEDLAHRTAVALENAILFAEARTRLTEATRAREEVAQLMAEREAAAAAQRAFLRDVLRSLTEGRLRLCDTESELPTALPPAEADEEPLALESATLRELRRRCDAAARTVGLPDERRSDLLLAVGEASMNAVVHAGGGIAVVHADSPTGVVQVHIRDEGAGISEGLLHRATLERGFSTGGTLGHGFSVMTQTCDRLYLRTGPKGTTVVIEQAREAPDQDPLFLATGW